jgi:hypothetical protein
MANRHDEQLQTIARLFEQDSWGRPFCPEDSPVLSACRGPQLSAMAPFKISRLWSRVLSTSCRAHCASYRTDSIYIDSLKTHKPCFRPSYNHYLSQHTNRLLRCFSRPFYYWTFAWHCQFTTWLQQSSGSTGLDTMSIFLQVMHSTNYVACFSHHTKHSESTRSIAAGQHIQEPSYATIPLNGLHAAPLNAHDT